eukprot:gene19465-biopygen2503
MLPGTQPPEVRRRRTSPARLQRFQGRAASKKGWRGERARRPAGPSVLTAARRTRTPPPSTPPTQKKTGETHADGDLQRQLRGHRHWGGRGAGTARSWRHVHGGIGRLVVKSRRAVLCLNTLVRGEELPPEPRKNPPACCCLGGEAGDPPTWQGLRARGHFWLGWRGRGAGMARAWPVTQRRGRNDSRACAVRNPKTMRSGGSSSAGKGMPVVHVRWEWWLIVCWEWWLIVCWGCPADDAPLVYKQQTMSHWCANPVDDEPPVCHSQQTMSHPPCHAGNVHTGGSSSAGNGIPEAHRLLGMCIPVAHRLLGMAYRWLRWARQPPPSGAWEPLPPPQTHALLPT